MTGRRLPTLTDRELQVLQGIDKGRSRKGVADALCLSEDTVKTYLRRLFNKWNARDRAEAISLGYQSGVLKVTGHIHYGGESDEPDETIVAPQLLPVGRTVLDTSLHIAACFAAKACPCRRGGNGKCIRSCQVADRCPCRRAVA